MKQRPAIQPTFFYQPAEKHVCNESLKPSPSLGESFILTE
jgi:hypothetical protein